MLSFLLNNSHSCNFKTAPCGPLVLNATNKIQVLTSPGYPNKYPDNIKCTWLMKKTVMTKPTYLKFVKFDLLNQSDTNICNKDRVEITETSV